MTASLDRKTYRKVLKAALQAVYFTKVTLRTVEFPPAITSELLEERKKLILDFIEFRKSYFLLAKYNRCQLLLEHGTMQ
jgi:hypothetical protein